MALFLHSARIRTCIPVRAGIRRRPRCKGGFQRIYASSEPGDFTLKLVEQAESGESRPDAIVHCLLPLLEGLFGALH